jgi:hypothetical protein
VSWLDSICSGKEQLTQDQIAIDTADGSVNKRENFWNCPQNLDVLGINVLGGITWGLDGITWTMSTRGPYIETGVS